MKKFDEIDASRRRKMESRGFKLLEKMKIGFALDTLCKPFNFGGTVCHRPHFFQSHAGLWSVFEKIIRIRPKRPKRYNKQIEALVRSSKCADTTKAGGGVMTSIERKLLLLALTLIALGDREKIEIANQFLEHLLRDSVESSLSWESQAIQWFLLFIKGWREKYSSGKRLFYLITICFIY